MAMAGRASASLREAANLSAGTNSSITCWVIDLGMTSCVHVPYNTMYICTVYTTVKLNLSTFEACVCVRVCVCVL